MWHGFNRCAQVETDRMHDTADASIDKRLFRITGDLVGYSGKEFCAENNVMKWRDYVFNTPPLMCRSLCIQISPQRFQFGLIELGIKSWHQIRAVDDDFVKGLLIHLRKAL